MTMTYDKHGNVLSIRNPNGTGHEYTYDARGHLLSCRHADGTGYDRTYDEHGNMLSHHRTNGTGYDFTYDAHGNTLSYRHTDGTGWDHTYDERGRVLSYRRTDGTGYDVIAHDTEYNLCRNLDGTYSAGCQEGLSLEQALDHWCPRQGLLRTNARRLRAAIFYKALLNERDALTNKGLRRSPVTLSDGRVVYTTQGEAP
jgi:YD repeat-containing protein